MTNNFFIKNIYSKFINIIGEDSQEFLQGIITNDINNCKEGNPIYACLLTPQGKFIADFFVIKLLDKYLIEILEKYFETFINKLKMYKLRSNVDFKENIEITSLLFFTQNTPKIEKKIITFNDPRNANIGLKIYLNSNDLKSIEFDNIQEYNYDKYKEILIKNIIPHTPDDLIENKSNLLENNFQNINAISWSKGCYVGQDITARMKYRALLKKKIYTLEIMSGEININDEIILNKIIFGKVISKVNKYILCMLKIDLVSEKSNNKESIEINTSTVLKFL